jgi:VanZ family protein
MEITCAGSPEPLVELVMTIRFLSQRPAWLLVLAIAVLTLSPIELRPVTAAPANWERFAAFMAIGALFCLGYPRHRLRIVWLVVGLAGLLEVLQHVSPSRHGRLPDGLVKAAGALLGVGVAVAAERMLERLRTRSRPGRDPRAPFLAQRTDRLPAPASGTGNR